MKDFIVQMAKKKASKVTNAFILFATRKLKEVKSSHDSLKENQDMVVEFLSNADLALFQRTLALTAKLTQHTKDCFMLSDQNLMDEDNNEACRDNNPFFKKKKKINLFTGNTIFSLHQKLGGQTL